MTPHARRRARPIALLTATVLAATALSTTSPAAAEDASPVVLTPIGGGYELESLQGFARAAADGASGPTVDIVVVPSSYGDAPADRAENLALAQQRTDQVDAACDAVVPAPYTGCTATLAVLLDRADALDPANSAAIDATGTDGVYVLGGDQGLAMSILAGSPAEAAMERAVARGAAVGGTSAGAAVESRSMINGYVGDLGPWDGLRRGSTLMWWGDDADPERGLSFGSERSIFDQHFYQRGRFGRLLSTIASSDERFGGASRLGVGVDYATGVRSTGDTTLDGVFGPSSVALLDLETLSSPVRWVGPNALLSTRNVVTHLMTPGVSSYDVPTRTLSLDGRPVAAPSPVPWASPSLASHAGVVYLGGDVSGDFTTGVMPQFVATARAADPGKKARIVVISASPKDKKTAKQYAAGLAAAGWTARVDTFTYGDKWGKLALAGAAGVVVVGADPTTLGVALADETFRQAVRDAVATAPAVLADQHMSAAFGTWWSPKADPTDDDYEDQGIEAFRAGDGQWQRGLGLVDASLVPRLTLDYQWGKLYDLARIAPQERAIGVGEQTALVWQGGSAGPAAVAGTGSAAVVDGRSGRLWTGSNGAIGAANVLLSTFAPGEQLLPTP